MSAENDAYGPQTPPVSLTTEQAAILLKGDLRNLAKKVQQGKTLSASERNLLQSTLAGEKTLLPTNSPRTRLNPYATLFRQPITFARGSAVFQDTFAQQSRRPPTDE